eukprot:scaffold192786_cov44-Prasinocladus_malaysianus.AAC.1
MVNMLFFVRPLFLVVEEKRHKCLITDYWPNAVLVVGAAVMQLIDYNEDIRKWWWANSAKLFLVWMRMLLMMGNSTYQVCAGEHFSKSSPFGVMAITLGYCFAIQLWCPVGSHLSLAVVPAQGLALLATMLLA